MDEDDGLDITSLIPCLESFHLVQINPAKQHTFHVFRNKVTRTLRQVTSTTREVQIPMLTGQVEKPILKTNTTRMSFFSLVSLVHVLAFWNQPCEELRMDDDDGLEITSLFPSLES